MAIDFFDQQDAAQRRTGLLIGYFVLAVVLIVVAVYLVVSVPLVYGKSQGGSAASPPLFDPLRFALGAAGVLLVIVLGSLYKTMALHSGGAAVAQLLGGRPVVPGSASPRERRLLNVVEEMALASGTAVPTVYLLDDEPAINAFAAGHNPGDAVIGVNRGTIEHLSRDELQGVIAHEFSHILHGDMRLNLRLIGLLHGILLIALIGYTILRSSNSSSSSRSSHKNRQDNAAGWFILGVGLMAVGYIGVFFGRLIKSAISRQREFLADASAVQYTRNPKGIAGALKKIGGLAKGSAMDSPNAEQASHMFFGAGMPFLFDAFATHPPLAERIRRLDPSFDGTFPKVEGLEPVEEDEASVAAFAPSHPRAMGTSFPLDPATAVATVGAPSREHVAYAAGLIASLPGPLLEAVHQPSGARGVIYALLLDANETVRRLQLEHLEGQEEAATVAELKQLEPIVASLGPAARIPLVDMTLPALRRLEPPEYQAFRAEVQALASADRRVSLFEFALERMLLRNLDRHFQGRASTSVPRPPPADLLDACAVLLSALAHMGQEGRDDVARAFAFGAARLRSTIGPVGLVSPERCTLEDVDRALSSVASASPQMKRTALDACAACIAADGRVTVEEGELLRVVADSLGCPMPPLLSAGTA